MRGEGSELPSISLTHFLFMLDSGPAFNGLLKIKFHQRSQNPPITNIRYLTRSSSPHPLNEMLPLKQGSNFHLPEQNRLVLSLEAFEVGRGDREEPLPPLGEELVPPDPQFGLGQDHGIVSVEEITGREGGINAVLSNSFLRVSPDSDG